LGPYVIEARVGRGGMGEVYRARDPRLNRDVAIKVSAERFSERFAKEARAIASLNHPNVCTYTGMRVPLMQGFPIMTSGLASMRAGSFIPLT
jgi:serine/threonine protein kinase